MLKRKDLLGLIDATEEEISEILSLAATMKQRIINGEKKMSDLEGKTTTVLFYENSTRTRTSFEQASKYLGATTINIEAGTSSVAKGETLVDTGKTLDAQLNDFLVMRHPMGGAPYLLAKTVQASVLNAGDGMNEHPTQALLDMLTMREQFGSLKGLKVAILGDIKHSRVAKSNLFGLRKLGAILGDHVEVGCNCVLNPGTVICSGTRVYPLNSLRGAFPKLSIVKSQNDVVQIK
mgnify:CR=1 FL=1